MSLEAFKTRESSGRTLLEGPENECHNCRAEEEELHFHHISYENDEGVMLCRSCHVKVHRRDGFRDDLKPIDDRPELRSVDMKQKNITIREEQDEWIRENHINLSSLVREAIDSRREQD